MTPVGKACRPGGGHRPEVVEQPVLLRDDDEIRTVDVRTGVLQHESVTEQIAAWAVHCPGQMCVVLLLRFVGRPVAVDQNELDPLPIERRPQSLEQRNAIAGQPSLDADDAASTHEGVGARRRRVRSDAGGLDHGVGDASRRVREGVRVDHFQRAARQGRPARVVGQDLSRCVGPCVGVQGQNLSGDAVADEFARCACVARREDRRSCLERFVRDHTPGIPSRRKHENAGACIPLRELALRLVPREQRLDIGAQQGGPFPKRCVEWTGAEQCDPHPPLQAPRHLLRHVQNERRVLCRHESPREQQIDVTAIQVLRRPHRILVGAERRGMQGPLRKAVRPQQPPRAAAGGDAGHRASDDKVSDGLVQDRQAALGVHRPVGHHHMAGPVGVAVRDAGEMNRVVAGRDDDVGPEGTQLAPDRRAEVDEASGVSDHRGIREHVGVLEGWQVPMTIRLALRSVDHLERQPRIRRQPVVHADPVRGGNVRDQRHPDGGRGRHGIRLGHRVLDAVPCRVPRSAPAGVPTGQGRAASGVRQLA